MLHVGVINGARAPLVTQQLVDLGAVRATGREDARAAIDEPVVYLHDASSDGSASGPCLHLVLGIAGSGAPTDKADAWLDGSLAQPELDEAVGALWRARIAPFEANLRASKRAPRKMQPELATPDPTWPSAAARLSGRLREVVGPLALRIDHIGSTSVPGLPAKDLIDLQVTVADLERAHRAAEAARRAGFVHVRGEWFGMDRFGVEHREEVVVDADPGRPTNVNFRPVTAPVWRETLLFRDWLRAHPDERDAYAAMKRDLTKRARAHVDDYGAAKMPWIRAAGGRAENWAERIGWEPPP